jgi:epoxyqueuosine reductase
MEPGPLTAALKQRAVELGFQLAGACPAVTPPGFDRFRQWLAAGYAGEMRYLADRADARQHPRFVLDGCRSLLMLAAVYPAADLSPAGPGEGRVSRYALGDDYHDLLHARLHQLADLHRRLVPGAKVRGVVDTAPLLEREFAQLAGLGWIGKNTMLLNRRLGSWFFLAALLTTETLSYDQPTETGHCGTCRACLDACPTGALLDAWKLDARRCISYLTIELAGPVAPDLRQPLGDRVFGCDVCQEVCPWNRRAARSAEEPVGDCPDFRPTKMGLSPSPMPPMPDRNPAALAPLFFLDDDAFRARFRHTPLWRPRRRGLLRSAALILGNRPHEASLPALAHGLNEPEPLVRGACAWALGRFDRAAGRELLRARLMVETDGEVRQEIHSALAACGSAAAGLPGGVTGNAGG